MRPTYFEAVTAAAFRWFADIAVDVAVIEVGMLGRWGATNIVNAQVAVITNIGLDHTSSPGRRWSTSREKAGIIKPGSAVVVGRPIPSWSTSSAPRAGRATSCAATTSTPRTTSWRSAGARWRCALRRRSTRTCSCRCTAPIRGQRGGAITAVEAFFAAPLPEELVNEGFANVEMPGRFEVMGVQPLTIIDGAHNSPGADVCASVFFHDFNPDGRRILVMGTLRNPTEMLSALRVDEFDTVHACTAPSPRGSPAQTWGGRRGARRP